MSHYCLTTALPVPPKPTPLDYLACVIQNKQTVEAATLDAACTCIEAIPTADVDKLKVAPMFYIPVTCHMSIVNCQLSNVNCQM